MAPRIAVIYYSATGNVHGMARALADGAEAAGAEVRIRRVAETAPDAAVQSNETWHQHATDVAPSVEVASLDDLEWADGIALGAPTRYGAPAAQLRNFTDTTGALWGAGALDGKAATAFTSAATRHGGLESTILAINNMFYHWGSIIVSLGYAADPHLMATGNPYGASLTGGDKATIEAAHQAARIQGRRLAEVAAKLAG